MLNGKYTKIGLMGAALLLSGCAEERLREFDGMQLHGTEFNKALARGYAEFARTESRQTYDDIDASYFAGKALDAAKGKMVMPENPDDWDIPCNKIAELRQSHQRLMKALNKGARTDIPEAAAAAQVFQDCWIEEVDETWQQPYLRMCRDGFMEKMAVVESLMDKETSSPAFVVLFSLNSATIDAEGLKVIDQAVAASQTQAGFKIHVLGRTDRLGDRKHNHYLAKHRAQAVKKALIERGISGRKVILKTIGETPGSLVEPDNRRADILWVK